MRYYHYSVIQESLLVSDFLSQEGKSEGNTASQIFFFKLVENSFEAKRAGYHG
jgi:hypothetical protein